jgi:hypothetical protein
MQIPGPENIYGKKKLGSYLQALRVSIQREKGRQYRNLKDELVCHLETSARTDEKPIARGAAASPEAN